LRNINRYTSPEYKELRLRQEFLDPFFSALGWDVTNTQGYSGRYRDVVIKETMKVGGAVRAPDYTFRLGGEAVFLAEAKKPSVDLHSDPGPALQLRSYGWTKSVPISVLTDFQELATYNTRVRPTAADKAATARAEYMQYSDYVTRWDEIHALLSPEAIKRGSLDKYVAKAKDRRGTALVDESFLQDIESWREALAKDIAGQNTVDIRELNYAVQQLLDRIIFLRMAEDRGHEPFGSLREAAGEAEPYMALMGLFKAADNKYNSGLFHFRDERG